jgi:hypothetical protein
VSSIEGAAIGTAELVGRIALVATARWRVPSNVAGWLVVGEDLPEQGRYGFGLDQLPGYRHRTELDL